MGSGYRIVAASRGLRPDEKKQITTRSPSHDGLCDAGPEAVGIAYYPLDSGRFCVAHTCCAGREGTARGGQRIYTRALLLDESALGQFGYNPFNVVRALITSGQAQPHLKPPPLLPALELPLGGPPEVKPLSRCVSDVGAEWLTCILRYVLDRQPVVVVGPFASSGLIEAVLLSVPGRLRMRLSFGAGLRFSLGRRFNLNALDGDVRQLQHAVRGHSLKLLAPRTEGAAPRVQACAWTQMARRRWEQDRWQELADLTSRDFGDCSAEPLEHYGRLCNLDDDVPTFDAAALIDLLADHLGPTPSDALRAELTIRLVRDALGRLTDVLSTAPVEELTRRWPATVSLWSRSARTLSLLSPLVGSMLRRLTRLSALRAAESAPRVIVTGLTSGVDAAPVRQALDDLLDHLGEWVHDSTPGDIQRLPALLDRWPPADALADRLGQLRAQISARLQPSSEA